MDMLRFDNVVRFQAWFLNALLNSSTLATSCKEFTHWKRLWCWDGLGAGGEGNDRGWDGWMASLTRWMWVWVNSGSWWWTGRPGVLQFMGLQRATRLSNWTELNWTYIFINLILITVLWSRFCFYPYFTDKDSFFILILGYLC